MEKLPIPKVYGAVTMGERGQIVIPAKVRKSFRIKPGDKLIVFTKDGGPIGLIPAEHFGKFLDQATQMLAHLHKGS